MGKMLCHAAILLFIVQLALAASVEEYKSYKNYKYYEIEGPKDDINALVVFLQENYEVPVFSIKNSTLSMIVAPELVPIVENISNEKKLQSKILIEDYSEIINEEKLKPRNGLGFSWTAYYDIDDINEYLRNTSKNYPKCTEVIVGGKSFEGRDILGLRINTPSDKKKPVIFIESGIHAREWITPATTTYFINQLLTSENPDIKALKEEFDWHIFPSINPDGYHYSHVTDRFWRKTRSKRGLECDGADPNRNWDHNWMHKGTSSNPCAQTFGGVKVFSEIETKSLSEYILKLENLKAYIGFHSDAQMLLLPYSDSKQHVDNYDDLKRIGQVSLDYGYKVNQAKYEGPATAAEILYPASGGSMDWVRHVKKTRLVFTYELRGYNFTWPAKRIPEQGDEVTQMMLGMVVEARKLGYFD
ncbi:zinc carboxypeptidase-like [Anticarsia gemmatalis]|uniref:zinc carboxypeptidase-like n=1 Tax=Anticarsia gemmatalis TaxID=129554 RepID=UPI003F76033B